MINREFYRSKGYTEKEIDSLQDYVLDQIRLRKVYDIRNKFKVIEGGKNNE